MTHPRATQIAAALAGYRPRSSPWPAHQPGRRRTAYQEGRAAELAVAKQLRKAGAEVQVAPRSVGWAKSDMLAAFPDGLRQRWQIKRVSRFTPGCLNGAVRDYLRVKRNPGVEYVAACYLAGVGLVAVAVVQHDGTVTTEALRTGYELRVRS